MFVSLLAVLAQTVATPAASAPPPIVSAPVTITSSVGQRIAASPYRVIEPPMLVGVRATAGGRLLLADEFRVDSTKGANYSQNRSEAPAQQCTGPERYDRQYTTSFSLRMSVRPNPAGQRLLSVSVNWTRPMDGASCVTNGTRGASIEQNVMVEPGKPVVLTGDGGLRIELSPR